MANRVLSAVLSVGVASISIALATSCRRDADPTSSRNSAVKSVFVTNRAESADSIEVRAVIASTDSETILAASFMNHGADTATARFGCIQLLLFENVPRNDITPVWDQQHFLACDDVEAAIPLRPGESWARPVYLERLVRDRPGKLKANRKYYAALRIPLPEGTVVLTAGEPIVLRNCRQQDSLTHSHACPETRSAQNHCRTSSSRCASDGPYSGQWATRRWCSPFDEGHSDEGLALER